MFTNPFYAGIFEWEGKTYTGKHQAMITLDEFDRVQHLLGRKGRPRPKTHTFTYTGMIRCGECGLTVTAEEKVNRFGSHYIYYHCTRRSRHYRCRQRSVALADLERQLGEFLGEISISNNLHQWAVNRLTRAFEQERETVGSSRSSLEQAYHDTTRHLDNLTNLRLRDLITDEEFAAKRPELQREQLRLKHNLDTGAQEGFWFEPARLFLSVSNRAEIWFRHGNKEQKRLIIEIVGAHRRNGFFASMLRFLLVS